MKTGTTNQFEFVDQTVPKTQTFLLNTENSTTLYRDLNPGLTADIQFTSIDTSPTFTAMNGRSFILQTLPPIAMPNASRDSVLPIRILDATGVAFLTGILHNGSFVSFTEGKPGMLTLPILFFLLFRLSDKDIDPQLKEEARRIIDTKEQRIRSGAMFERGKTDPNSILQPIASILSGKVVSYSPTSPTSLTTPAYYGMPAKPAQEYTIPASAAFSIMQTLDIYKTKLAIDSCPAMVRAKSLLDEIQENRRIRTKFCSDMYWTQTNLGKIYPYATFQFLCIKDWSSPTLLEPAFNTFCNKYMTVYADVSGFAPKLIGPAVDVSGSMIPAQFGRLDSMRFDSASYETLKKAYCATGTVLADPEQINGVLQELNAEFANQITGALKIIDSLIIVIKDPDTNTFVARLSPEITSRKRSTKEFILKQKEQAIQLLSNHYIRVEELYLKGIRTTLRA